MAQQTAMQEAIEYLKLFNLESSAIILEDKFLEIEKKQIAKAWDERCFHSHIEHTLHIYTENGEQYYNETYNK